MEGKAFNIAGTILFSHRGMMYETEIAYKLR
mgnify:CR=1 FL=1